MKYNIIDIRKNGKRVLKPVDGESVILKGFEEFDFFSHYDETEIVISECTTGGKIASSLRNLEECKERAIKNIDSVGRQNFFSMLEIEVNKTGKIANV